MSLFPSEAEQIASINQAESEKPFAFSISQEDVDHILRLGGNSPNHRMSIVVEFMKSKPIDDLAGVLKAIYHGGNGFETDSGRFSVWYGEDGIRIAKGDSARHIDTAQIVSWHDAAVRVGQLLDEGRFATNQELVEAPGRELEMLASALYFLRINLTDQAKKQGFLSSVAHENGIPWNTWDIQEALQDSKVLPAIQADYARFAEAYRENPKLLRMDAYRIERIAQSIAELSISRREYDTELIELPAARLFITQDEIDAALARGNGFSHSKSRIYAYFSESHTAQEKADFLKNEYGIGGLSGALSSAFGSHEEHNAKGIQYRKDDCPDVNLSWNAVARRIDELIQHDRYLSDADRERMTEQREQAALPEVPASEAVQDEPSVEPIQEDDTPQSETASSFPAERASRPLTQDEIDEALRRWNGDIVSKRAVVRYMKKHARERDTAAWLAHEYGGTENTPLHITVTGVESVVTLTWPKVQRRIAQLINEDRFYTDIERDNMDDIDPIAIREALAERGIVNGELVDPEAQDRDPFIQKVMADVERIAREEAEQDVEPTIPETPARTAELETPAYHVGDTVYLDETAFQITEIRDSEVQLLDPTLVYPVFRAESRENFERLLRLDDRNAALFAPPVSEETKPQPTTKTVAYYPAEENHMPFDVVVQTLSTGGPERTPPTTPLPENFRITDDHLGEGGAKTKYGYNIAAIRTLKQIEQEGRAATPEEQQILSRYVGWGGIPQAFDADNAGWSDEYAELKALLTENEYDMARASTLNAHYTSPTVVHAIYDAVERMGFKTGNVLEPSCGVGNFFGMMPESMRDSRLYGVELDSITGRIARQLYPKADITIDGFEHTDRRDFFDLAVGNVPFGSYKLSDKRFDKHNFLIHDYFFAKALDQVRPGGVIAFVTSKGTLDKQNPDVRKYIAQRAELLGAIRLPNNAFKANAGTEVTTDIIFLQKRESPRDIEPDWVHLAQTDDGIPINSYFAEHPEMVLGRMAWDDSMYGSEKETACLPIEGAVLSDQLAEAVQHIEGTYTQAELPELAEGEEIEESIPATPDVKNYSYTLVDGQVYYRENSRMVRPDLNATAQERVKGMIGLRDCVQRLINAQLYESGDATIHNIQTELNELYDRFSAKYGLINSRANSSAFSADSSYYLLCSLEILNENGELERKADMFTKRTIRQQRVIDHVDTSEDALALSIAERARVDLPYMAQLCGKPEEEVVRDLLGVIYRVPAPEGEPVHYVTSDEYLSGNVREKLRVARLAAQSDESLSINVKALEAAQPQDLDASEIDVRLGATWIKQEYIQKFMHELLNTSYYLRDKVQVLYSPLTSEWSIQNKTLGATGNIAATVTYGTDRANAFRILEDTLNLRDVRIFDVIEDDNGKEKRVLNEKETTLAQQKQQAINDAFREWIWKDPDRRRDLVQTYNEKFNSIRPREYDGRHISFVGMNPEIQLRDHQRNAIAHVLYGGNTLLAHEVGAGKSFEMAAAAMESKRLGLCQKSLFVVPNHLTEQMAAEMLRLYPSANILVATKRDFETKNRKKFCSKIATGDYDAVIIGHSQFERIPISAERQERLLREQIHEITAGIDELKHKNGDRFGIKQMEKTKKSLEARLKKLTDAKKDDVITFEQLGVDRLFVDEAHAYKNLFLYTKMRNIAGLSTSEAQKSTDMFLKCRYMDELTGGRGVIFATGTPVSNSMTELYTMQRYLQYDALVRNGLSHFDAWASTFGETKTSIELAPEGTGYRARKRFSRFYNLPELMAMFREVADIKTADQLHLPTPEAHFETVVVEPTEHQKEMVQALSVRAAKVHSGAVTPDEDNMLTITSDGRKLGLDQRLINPLLPDDPSSKVNSCVNNVFRIWQEGASEKLTQLVFCDLSTPKGGGSSAPDVELEAAAKALPDAVDSALPRVNDLDAFNIYDDIREKLVARGIPRHEIAFIHEANSEVQKKELFAKVRSGQVRILMGSTQKMGAGTNVQDRLVALHDIDCPWRPGDLEQRAGRIVRQGNMNPHVNIFRYVTNGTFDAYLWQTVENKQKFISQIMTSKTPLRSCEGIDETVLSYAEIKALCAGDPRIKEKMDLDVEVARLRLMKADHQSQRYRLEDQLMRGFPQEIERNERYLVGFKKDVETVAAHPLPTDKKDFVGMEVKGDMLTDRDNAGAAILEACKKLSFEKSEVIGHYRGFEMSLMYDPFQKKYQLTLQGEMSHRVELGTDARGNLVRIENALDGIPDRIRGVEARLVTLREQQEVARDEVSKPFPYETELTEKSARLALLDSQLDIDRDHSSPEQSEVLHKQARPSVLEKLEAAKRTVSTPTTKKQKDMGAR